MGDLGDLIVFLIIAIVWVISQVGRLRKGTGTTMPTPRPRPKRRGPGTSGTGEGSRQAPQGQVTLEEWMEQVRRGQQPSAPTKPQPRRRTQPAQRQEQPGSAQDILREWQERTQQPTERSREVPRAKPAPTSPPDDPYAQDHEHEEGEMHRASIEAEELREAEKLAEKLRERERKLERKKRQERAIQRQAEERRGKRLAVPRMPKPPRVRKRTKASNRGAYAQQGTALAVASGSGQGGLNLTRQGLRNGIVLMEVLGPPVALRKEPPPTQHFERRPES